MVQGSNRLGGKPINQDRVGRGMKPVTLPESREKEGSIHLSIQKSAYQHHRGLEAIPAYAPTRTAGPMTPNQ